MRYNYSEVWFVKKTSKSEPEKVILFFDYKLLADVTHDKAVKENDARVFFGNKFPKKIASCWQ